MRAEAALTSEAAGKNSNEQPTWGREVSVHDELNMTMQDALEDLDKNHETESNEFDAALQDASGGSDKHHLTESNDFEFEREEWNVVINSMIMNVCRAGGSVSGDQPILQLRTSFRDRPRVEHMNIRDHVNGELHTVRSKQHDKTLVTQRLDVDETGGDQGHSKGGSKAIYVKHRGEVQTMTEQELRCLSSKNNEVYVVYDGKIVTPEAIGRLKDHAIVQVVDKLTGGGKKKNQRKSNQTESDQSGSSSSEADVFYELMEKNFATGEGWN